MADDSEVGKVSLGLELGDSSPIEKQISSVANKSGNIFTKTMQGAMRSVMKGFKSSVKPVTVEAPKVDNSQLKADIDYYENLSAGLNHKIDLQQQKLEGLKESLKSTFNDERKSKLEQQIANADVQILRMGRQADTAYDKMLKLKGQLADTGQTANQAAPKVDKVTTSLTNMSKPLKSAKGNFNAAAKAATRTSKSFTAAGKSSTKMGNQITQAFGRIAKQVLVFSVLYKAIRGFQSYMNSSMKTNHEYAASLNAIKTNLATAFQPVFSAVMPAINSFMSWLAKATAYIAAFMASLFGTSYKQSFAAAKGLQNARKAMEGYGKAAKKTSKGLSALDDFNLIKTQDDPESGGAKPGDWNMEMPDLDIDSVQSKTDSLVANMKNSFNGVWESLRKGWKATVQTFGPSFQEAWGSIKPSLEGWKVTFQQVFSDIIALGEPLKNWWTNHLIPLWQKEVVVVGEIVGGLLDSLNKMFETFWMSAYPIWQKIITEGLPVLSDLLSGATDILGNLFNVVKTIFDDIWQGVINPVMQLISKVIRDVLDIIFGVWNQWGKKIVDGLKLALDKVKELWNTLFDKFLKPNIDSALKVLSELWDKHLKGLVKEVLNFVGKLATAALDILNKFVLPITNWLIKTLGPVFAEIFSGVMKVIGSALGGIIDAAKGIIKALGGIVDFIAGVFTGDWKKAWNGIKTFMQGIGDAIVGIFKAAVNSVIEAINWMLRQINKLNIDIPDWVPGVGGKSLGFSIAEIPKLANGGLVSAPTLAMVGDNRNASIDPEVVTPLSKLQDMLDSGSAEQTTILTMMLEVLREIARKNPSLKIGETEFGRLITKTVNSQSRQTGRAALEL